MLSSSRPNFQRLTDRPMSLPLLVEASAFVQFLSCRRGGPRVKRTRAEGPDSVQKAASSRALVRETQKSFVERFQFGL
ncbi:hypothetical protein H6P81_014169 [Aristolochia fimbriata]|uniref:Uncharacterized protein n=1 Tax=Aristolochia fimbriata TaxID=158543 RepID=A0AAV7EHX6_ARIFI|nr:hypothetical protein H6P81_014169 [Aristolochia fimbriata]